MIAYQEIQREAEIATLADMMRNGIDVEPGREFAWQTRFGDEGEGSWTRGRSEATAGMIAAAEARILEIYDDTL